MRKLVVLLSALVLTASSTFASPTPAAQPKEWTFLIFLNGNNNLDSFGKFNIKQMEKVGSTKNINILVQWASLSTRKVERLLIKKVAGSDVGSTVLQNLGSVDMGDWHSIVDFVKYGVQNYPAQKYFIDVWDHGSGWHDKNGVGRSNADISWDEISGHHITTEQLGLALTESAKIIGHKVDLYASDACLMAMPEIAYEMADSVSIFGGSEETEPGAGWPYDALLKRWSALPSSSAAEVSKILSEEYAKYYQANGGDSVTFSAFDLSQFGELNKSILAFSKSLTGISTESAKLVINSASKSQNFAVADYVDFVDFLKNLKASQISTLNTSLIDNMNAAASKFIISSQNVNYPNAHGMALWIPTSSSTYAEYADRYSKMKFDAATHWGDALKTLLR